MLDSSRRKEEAERRRKKSRCNNNSNRSQTPAHQISRPQTAPCVMMEQDYQFFRENIKRTILSQSRYLCPRTRNLINNRATYHLQHLRKPGPPPGTILPLLPHLKEGIVNQSSPSSTSDHIGQSCTSITTDISETGQIRKSLKVTIPTVRPWSSSQYSDCTTSIHSGGKEKHTPTFKVFSPVWVTVGAPSTESYETDSSVYTSNSIDTSLQQSMSISTKLPSTSSSSGNRTYTKGTDTDSDCLDHAVFSGVCLLNSLEMIGRRTRPSRPSIPAAKVTGVRSVLHRQL